MQKFDIVIIGAGPSGLCFAISLAKLNLSVLIIEKQSLEKITDPDFDGREIALTHTSKQILQNLNIWQNFNKKDVFPLVDAHIYNGTSKSFLNIKSQLANKNELGYIVTNKTIRKFAYKEFKKQCSNFQLITDKSVSSISNYNNDGYVITLSDNCQIFANLVVSADSRFSQTRRMLGIGAKIRDFGKSMLICRFNNELPHKHIAREWFGYKQTLALLPLEEHCISVVLTLPHQQAEQLYNLNDELFTNEIQLRSNNILGNLSNPSSRHIYPLVGVYANTFILDNYALIGDAAIGMHPITAHGFNFGLISQQLLTKQIKFSLENNLPINNKQSLIKYNNNLKQKSLPLYLSTNFIVSIFTNDSFPMNIVREKILQVANKFYPLKKMIAKHLTKTS